MDTPDTAAALLRRAKERIGTPEKWTKGFLARNGRRYSESPYSERATCWCAVGAIAAELRMIPPDLYLDAVNYLSAPLRGTAFPLIADFNDAGSTHHADIMRLYDEAILLAETAS